MGLAERRTGVKLSEAQRAQADALVAQGHEPRAVVRAVAEATAPATTPTAATGSPATPKPHLNAAETTAYGEMRRKGLTHPQAMASIEQQRAFQQQFGLPSSEAVRTAVLDRNATGRWAKKP